MAPQLAKIASSLALVLALSTTASMYPAAADELDDLTDNPSAYCQDQWLKLADALKGDSKTLALARDRYAQMYADCMQDTKVEIAKREKETPTERQIRQLVDRESEECTRATKDYVLRQISQLPTYERSAAIGKYFTFYYKQCMNAKYKSDLGTP
jgi:hypothetical protein